MMGDLAFRIRQNRTAKKGCQVGGAGRRLGGSLAKAAAPRA